MRRDRRRIAGNPATRVCTDLGSPPPKQKKTKHTPRMGGLVDTEVSQGSVHIRHVVSLVYFDF